MDNKKSNEITYKKLIEESFKIGNQTIRKGYDDPVPDDNNEIDVYTKNPKNIKSQKK